MRDPYEVLGVARTATPDEIRKAYRKLAKGSHPDLHPGDAKAEARFKEISTANDLLSDADKRARFDRGEIDAAGNERPRQREFYRGFADGPGKALIEGLRCRQISEGRARSFECDRHGHARQRPA